MVNADDRAESESGSSEGVDEKELPEGTDKFVLTRAALQEIIRAELAVAVEKIVEEMHTDHDSMLNGLGG